MNKSELAQLGYNTEGLTPDADYVPNVVSSDEGTYTDLVYRGYLQLEELDAMGGAKVLGGPTERLDEIRVAMDDGVELTTAVGRFGDEGQQQRVRQLIADGQVTGS